MAFQAPRFSKGQVNRAGEVLRSPVSADLFAYFDANTVLSNWRAAHAYPINTFQATLRAKLAAIDQRAIVAQRLKRAPSIIAKLQRFPKMELARMQDIGGLRAVLSTVPRVRSLEAAYRESRFTHLLVDSKDYISSPKADGYRGIHLIYRYSNPIARQYDGLHLELQIRTRLQHAWATAVETMGTFLGQALKSGQGEARWKRFFTEAAAALTFQEATPPVPGFDGLDRMTVFTRLAATERSLGVLGKLHGFSIAATNINAERGTGAYHLVVLNSETRVVSIRPFPRARLDEANAAYAECEKRALEGERIEAVLVSAGPIEALKKAYPNYFLDTGEFISHIKKIIRISEMGGDVTPDS